MCEIIPAILPSSIQDMEAKLNALPKEVKLIHLDVLDEATWTDIKIDFEAHLMTPFSEESLWLWARRGAKRIITHNFGKEIRDLKKRVEIGLGVELQVPLEKVFPKIPEVDFLQLMSIAKIGSQGQPLDEGIFARIEKVRKEFPRLTISVDGGVKLDNLNKLKDSGADRLVIGSGFASVWKSLMKN